MGDVEIHVARCPGTRPVTVGAHHYPARGVEMEGPLAAPREVPCRCSRGAILVRHMQRAAGELKSSSSGGQHPMVLTRIRGHMFRPVPLPGLRA